MTATILSPDHLADAVAALKQGSVVAIPTETVYGLAANARNVEAVTKVFAVKERPTFDPLIVHIRPEWGSLDALIAERIVDGGRLSSMQRGTLELLMAHFWPGPLTLILPKHQDVPDLVTSGLDLVGVRMPDHPVAQQILRECDLPLAAPSANRFGRISPTCAADVMSELGDRIDWVVDGGPCSIGVESTVVALEGNKIFILRPGQVTVADLQECLSNRGCIVETKASHLDHASPGTLAGHYAPRKPMHLLGWNDVIPRDWRGKQIALMTLGVEHAKLKDRLTDAGVRIIASEQLSESGAAPDVARNLFATMRQLDQTSCDLIVAERPLTQVGLWHAIVDRLTRASSKRDEENIP